MESFPSDYYDEDYYSGMKSGPFRHFVANDGRLLQSSSVLFDLIKLRPGMTLLDARASPFFFWSALSYPKIPLAPSRSSLSQVRT